MAHNLNIAIYNILYASVTDINVHTLCLPSTSVARIVALSLSRTRARHLLLCRSWRPALIRGRFLWGGGVVRSSRAAWPSRKVQQSLGYVELLGRARVIGGFLLGGGATVLVVTSFRGWGVRRGLGTSARRGVGVVVVVGGGRGRAWATARATTGTRIEAA